MEHKYWLCVKVNYCVLLFVGPTSATHTPPPRWRRKSTRTSSRSPVLPGVGMQPCPFFAMKLWRFIRQFAPLRICFTCFSPPSAAESHVFSHLRSFCLALFPSGASSSAGCWDLRSLLGDVGGAFVFSFCLLQICWPVVWCCLSPSWILPLIWERPLGPSPPHGCVWWR